jgi:hypothetical protein
MTEQNLNMQFGGADFVVRTAKHTAIAELELSINTEKIVCLLTNAQ